MTREPEISIIMPAYNAEKHILSSIESVIAQTFQNWELITVDDGSTDNTEDIIQSVRLRDSQIKYFYQEDKRLGAARNSGLKLAKRLWIAFLDSDHLWEPEKLALQLQVAENNDADIIYTDGYMLLDGLNKMRDYPTRPGWFTGMEMYRILFEKNIVPVLSVLMKREWVEKTGYEDEGQLIFGCEDWDYWLRAARAGANFYGMPQKLFKYKFMKEG